MRPLIPVITLALLLASCNNQSAAGSPPSIYVAPESSQSADAQPSGGGGKLSALAVPAVTSGGSNVRTFRADINATVVTHVDGMPDQVSSSPAGLQTAFLIQGGNIKTRVDYPATAFSDNRSRILTYDKNTGVAKIMFADNLAVDPDVEPANVSGMLQGQQNFAAQQIDSLKPFAKVSLIDFQTKAAAAGAVIGPTGISAQSITTAQVTKSFTVPGGSTQQSTLIYDSNSQAVSQIRSTIEDTKSSQQSTSTISYAPVTGLLNVTIPYRIDTTQTITLKSTLQTATVNQTVNYDTIQLNTLSDAYFLVGGS